MVHLSNTSLIISMMLYSLITFFITPVITRPMFKNYQDPCLIGFIIGFFISIILWVKHGKNLVGK